MKWIKHLIDDANTTNEKSFVGFLAFAALLIVLLVDVISKFMGKPVIISQFIFDGFIWIVFGAFGIASVDKYINKQNINNTDNTPKANE